METYISFKEALLSIYEVLELRLLYSSEIRFK